MQVHTLNKTFATYQSMHDFRKIAIKTSAAYSLILWVSHWKYLQFCLKASWYTMGLDVQKILSFVILFKKSLGILWVWMFKRFFLPHQCFLWWPRIIQLQWCFSPWNHLSAQDGQTKDWVNLWYFRCKSPGMTWSL